MVDKLKLFFAIQKMHLKTAFSSKVDAFVNVVLMTINDLCFVLMWWILFQNRPVINGWNFDDMLMVFAITANAFGIFAIFFKGVNEISTYIENGTLDSFLTLPRSPLLMLSTSYSTFANWANFFAGYLFFFLSNYVSLNNFLMLALASFYGFLLLYSYRLLTASFSFFAQTDQLGHNLFMALVIFMHQPPSIFVGWYKVMFLTIIPAGFLSFFPANLIRDFSWMDFLYLNLGCFGFFFAAVWLFYHGLKRYSSGSRFGIR